MIERPKGFADWLLVVALIAGITRMYLFEHPTSFQFLVILLLLAIFSRLNRDVVTKHTHHIEIKQIAERK